MRFLCMVAIVLGMGCLVAQAGGEIVPAHLQGEMRYDEATGLINPAPLSRGGSPALWSVTDLTGDAYVVPQGDSILDWGDIQDGLPVGEVAFSFLTNSQASAGDNLIYLVIYSNDNGWNSPGKQIVAGYEIANVPGSTHPLNEYWGYLWRLQPHDPFILSGDDLDGDGLTDFGYAIYNQTLRTAGAMGGMWVAGPTDPDRMQYSSGIEDAFDTGAGTLNFGGDPFAQFYFELCAPSCSNNPYGGSACPGDLNFDCVVDLRDLAELLANYGGGDGALWWEGDIEPYQLPLPGDGSIELVDLAAFLSYYGDDCR